MSRPLHFAAPIVLEGGVELTTVRDVSPIWANPSQSDHH
jgi:hypothetical protein